ncbi:MAG: hypothetical protein ABEI13_02120 [Candidatus Paceibacteria bacterium]
MPKLKTQKSVANRIKRKKRKHRKDPYAVMKLRQGRNHFNAKWSGNVKRRRRKETPMNVAKQKVDQSAPYT